MIGGESVMMGGEMFLGRHRCIASRLGRLRSHVPRGGRVYSGRTGSVVAVRELLSAVAVEQENLIRLREGVKSLRYLQTHASIYVFGLTLRVTHQNRGCVLFGNLPVKWSQLPVSLCTWAL